MLTKPPIQLGVPFSIEETRYGEDVVVLSFAGELDLAVIETAKEALEPVAEGSKLVVIDLTRLEFLDASGVTLLLRLARTRAAPDSLRLLSSRHDEVNRILEATGVGSVIRIVADSEPSAR
jgi:anti-sigma B factor antagonist